ncbi:glycosyltransferase family 2 protein [Pollutimonas sp. M17]|uniref:glycosyltransferase family 2 protein n=1 Tax=Pollutimonas sp. M17 TaxID=2962065 RepID=UPI0021F42647|nr:glycosyltransferase family 2 protein [Pollutimonas sp. M17]UYO93969.1 glycosyltransferase family 2 protein [Pollutimonas sp. M17]
MTNSLVTPVLFLIFRQPEVTRTVFEQIRAARPCKLYIAADGPRPERPDDIAECEATRAVVAQIDWDCEVHTRFLPSNLGLKRAVSSALDWFFEAEEEGIILEYDCLPDPSFFPYCQAMLERYRNDTRIFSITGNNIQADIRRGDGDYYLSRFTAVWGWASWRRSWALWRPNLEDFDEFLRTKVIESIVANKEAQQFWIKTFEAVHNGLNVTTWAFCLIYAQIKQGSYCVVPNHNLIKNIGFGAEGTNAVEPNHPLAHLTTCELTSYNEPTFFIPDLAADIEFSLRAAYSPPVPFLRWVARYLRQRLRSLKDVVKTI